MKSKFKLVNALIATLIVVASLCTLSSCDDPDFQEGFRDGWNWSTGNY